MSIFISFSIDLAGSTYAKQVIKEICKAEDRQDQLLRTFCNILNDFETRLYNRLIRQPGQLEKLFMVKSLGDELWYTIEYEPQIDGDLLETVICFLLEVSALSPLLTITSEKIAWQDQQSPRPADYQIQHVGMGIKTLIDVFEDGIDCMPARTERIMPVLRQALAEQNPGLDDRRESELLAEILPRLNLGNISHTDGKTRVVGLRSDPIGPSVDRFFRCGKYCNAGMLTLGHSLVNKLNWEIPAPNSLRMGFNNGSRISYKHNSYYSQVISPGEMKGIDYPYELLHLPTLVGNGLFSKEQIASNDIYEKSREILLKQGFLNARYFRDEGKWSI